MDDKNYTPELLLQLRQLKAEGRHVDGLIAHTERHLFQAAEKRADEAERQKRKAKK